MGSMNHYTLEKFLEAIRSRGIKICPGCNASQAVAPAQLCICRQDKFCLLCFISVSSHRGQSLEAIQLGTMTLDGSSYIWSLETLARRLSALVRPPPPFVPSPPPLHAFAAALAHHSVCYMDMSLIFYFCQFTLQKWTSIIQ
ncbi:uncharacterized protein [Triticum aestivum]|uniref:uncharacterized protein isoform X2 n=1 Tax=Triticum aestivum TaxID=4565 RepID=UPI001D01EB1F|nr:uncharacterized protein LOC123159456 isoform X2 [Triticum aestivum]